MSDRGRATESNLTGVRCGGRWRRADWTRWSRSWGCVSGRRGFRRAAGRRLVSRLALVVAVFTSVVVWLSVPAWASDGPPGLSVTSAKAVYVPGEDVALTFAVTNGSSVACQLSASPDGTVDIMALTRDGVPVTPDLTSAYFGNGLRASLRAGLTTEQPGGVVRFPAVVIAGALRTVTPVRGGGGAAALWPTGLSGRYVVSVVYAVPVLAPLTVSQCVGDSAVATVSFTVATPNGRSSMMWWAVAAFVGIVLLALLWWWIRRRAGRTGVVVATALLVVGIVGVGAGGGGHPAYASWGVNQHGDAKFAAAVTGCFQKFDAPGGDPAKIMSTIEKPGNPHVDIREQLSGAGPNTTGTPNAAGGPGSSTILWNPNADEDHSDGGAIDACTELYHELVHANQFAKKTASTYLCDDTNIQVDEVEASIAENQYRATHHLGVRINYNGNLLPPNIDVCKDRKPAPASRTPLLKDYGAGCTACAATNGDPHLTTFDGNHYDFQAVGEFIAARSPTGDLEIQTRQGPLAGLRTISVNTAVALRVGADRLGFYLVDGAIAVHLNGRVIASPADALTLPGGGSLIGGTSPVYLNGDGFSVTWPDSSRVYVDQIGPWGLRVYVQLATGRKSKVSGLFGNDDGNPANDLITRTGVRLPAEPTFAQIYSVFAPRWRIDQSGSLFDYRPGQTTATFTDLSFPDYAITAAELPAAVRTQAQAGCRYVGVSAPIVLRDCILDLGLTGQQAFAVSASDTQATFAGTPGAAARSWPLTVTTPGQTATYAFAGTAGQKIYVNVSSATVPGGCGILQLLAPDGTIVASGCIIDGHGDIDAAVLPVSGQYRIVLHPPGGATGQAVIQVITAIDETGPISVGATATMTIRQPGAISTLTFSARAGQNVFIDVPTATIPTECGVLTLLGPDGVELGSGCIISGVGYIDAAVLPITGTYRIVVDPARNSIGSAQIRLTSYTDQLTATTIGSPTSTMTIAQPGAVSSLTFPASAGSKIAVHVSSAALSDECGGITLYGPDGVQLQGGCVIGGAGDMNSDTLLVTGTYRIVFDLTGDSTGSIQIHIGNP